MPAMPRTTALQIPLDPITAAHARVEADRCGLSVGEWGAAVLRRELSYAGDADALAAKIYEVAVASAHLLHALMLDTIGPEATARALAEATHAANAAGEAIAAELARAAEVDP
jgi:hypothetical protein